MSEKDLTAANWPKGDWPLPVVLTLLEDGRVVWPYDKDFKSYPIPGYVKDLEKQGWFDQPDREEES